MAEKRSGSKTLLWSVIMSSPGPLVVGLSLLSGHSSTQTADFFRRSAEFLAILTSFTVYGLTHKGDFSDNEKRVRLEKYANIFVGSVMLICGVVMFILALANGDKDKGNVIPSLVIALLSAAANSVFWIKYRGLYYAERNPIMKTQASLYRAKTLIDACVSAALITVIHNPDSKIAFWFDLAGSVIVAIYLSWCGISTFAETVLGRKISSNE